MESRMYDQGFTEWAKPRNWVKVILRAFAIRKTVYFASGGYQYRFDRFSEWLLAATLHRQGRVLGYAPGVGVEHLYSNNFSLLEKFIREFTDGECLFRASTQEPELCAAYFGAPLEWAQVRSAGDRRWAAIARIHGFLRCLMSRSTTEQERRLRTEALASLRRIALIDLAGGWPLLLRYRLRAQVAKLIVHMSVRDSPRCYRAFVHFWEAATQFCRVRWLLASNHSVRATAVATAGPNGDLTDDTCSDSIRWNASTALHSAGLARLREFVCPRTRRRTASFWLCS
jgi:hypothetical protein